MAAEDAFLADLNADIDDCTRLIALAERPVAKTVLEAKVRELTLTRDRRVAALAKDAAAAEAASAAASASAAAGGGPAGASPPASATKSVTFIPIDTFGWDETADKATVYITSGVDGVGSLPKDSVVCDFKDRSFDLKITGLGTPPRNFRLQRELYDEVDPSRCSVKVKSNRITVILRKLVPQMWYKLVADKKKAPSVPKTDDPSAGLMDMMKNLYDSGDADMKRTIAEAWTKAQDARATGGDAFPPMP